jgi:AcrR family transcriptional regulator
LTGAAQGSGPNGAGARRRRVAPAEARQIRGRIVAMATRIVRRDGLAGLTFIALGRELHLRTVTIVRYGRDLDEIYDAVTVEAQGELIDLAAGAVGELRGRAALQALLEAHRVYALAQPHMYEAAMRRPAREASLTARPGGRPAGRYGDALAELEARALQSCGAAEAQAARLSWCVRAVLHGAVRLELRDKSSGQFEIDQNFERLLKLLESAARDAAAPGYTAA